MEHVPVPDNLADRALHLSDDKGHAVPAIRERQFGDLDERRFRLLVESITDYAIFMLDLDGRVSNWNAGAERAKGYKAVEIVGQHFSRFYTAEDRTRNIPAQALETALSTGRFETEGWRLRKDGSRFWAHVVIDLVRDDDGTPIGFAKITRDRTEQRKADAAALESERRFRHLVQGVTDYAIYMLDLDGIVANWNAGAERAKGYTAEDIVGQHFSCFYTEEDRPPASRRAGLRPPSRPAVSWPRAGGSGRTGADSGPMSSSTSSETIPARRSASPRSPGTRPSSGRSMRPLSKPRRRFRHLVQSVTDYAIYMLDLEGIVAAWNAGAERAKGYRKERSSGSISPASTPRRIGPRGCRTMRSRWR